MRVIVHTAVPRGLDAQQLDVHVTARLSMRPAYGSDNDRRIRSALYHSMFQDAFSFHIALTGSHARETVPSSNLAGALAAVVSLERLSAHTLTDTLVLGELQPNGAITAIRGVLPILSTLRHTQQRRTLLLSRDNLAEAQQIEGFVLIPVKTLAEAVATLNQRARPRPTERPSYAPTVPDPSPVHSITTPAIAHALDVAAAGPHHVLLIGGPGSRATELARASIELCPPLTRADAIRWTSVHSLTGAFRQLLTHRPIRAPHHTVSALGMIGSRGCPGELSLGDVLILEDVVEFSPYTLDTLAAHLSQGHVSHASQHDTPITFPAASIIIATMAPCPCGWYGHPHHRCRCEKNAIARHHGRLPVNFRSLIDLTVTLPPLPTEAHTTRSFTERRERIANARAAHALHTPTREVVQLSAAAATVGASVGQTAADAHRTLRLAATIARLAGRNHALTTDDVLQALTWRRAVGVTLNTA